MVQADEMLHACQHGRHQGRKPQAGRCRQHVQRWKGMAYAACRAEQGPYWVWTWKPARAEGTRTRRTVAYGQWSEQPRQRMCAGLATYHFTAGRNLHA